MPHFHALSVSFPPDASVSFGSKMILLMSYTTAWQPIYRGSQMTWVCAKVRRFSRVVRHLVFRVTLWYIVLVTPCCTCFTTDSRPKGMLLVRFDAYIVFLVALAAQIPLIS